MLVKSLRVTEKQLRCIFNTFCDFVFDVVYFTAFVFVIVPFFQNSYVFTIIVGRISDIRNTTKVSSKLLGLIPKTRHTIATVILVD